MPILIKQQKRYAKPQVLRFIPLALHIILSLQLQPKSCHLKRPDLNLDSLPITCDLNLIFIILEYVTLRDLLHRQNSPLQYPLALPTHRIIHSAHHTPAFPLRQLTTADILVIFATLDGVDNEVRCA